MFVLTEPQKDVWIISDHRSDPAPCQGDGAENGSGEPGPGADSESPAKVIGQVYSRVAAGDVLGSCGLFTSQGSSAFATSFGETNCGSVIRKLALSDKAAYGATIVSAEAVTVDEATGQVTVTSCAGVTGGPPLGRFTLAKIGEKWRISDQAKCT